MAIGMLIASPLAGIWADQRGSRALAAWGMVVGAVALAGMTTLGVRHAVLLVGAVAVRRRRRVGHVQLAQHGGDDGHRAGRPARDRGRRADDAAEHRRGDLDRVRAGGRDLLGGQGHAVQDLLGRDDGPVGRDAGRRSSRNMHLALWILAATSRGRRAACSLLRPKGRAAMRIGALASGGRDDGRGPSATTRRSGCCRRRARGRPVRTASTARPTSSGCASCCG